MSSTKFARWSNFFHLIYNLTLTSRLNHPGCLFTTFGGVLSTLVAGLTKSTTDPDSITGGFILRQTALCFLHCIFAGAAGNTWNDWVDRDIDAKVARSKHRPLASGRVSTTAAMAWIICLYLMSGWVLDWMVDGYNVLKIMLPLTALVILYPFCKRPSARKLHIYPQYILGTVLGGSTLSGYTAIYGRQLTFGQTLAQCFPLHAFLFFWSFCANTAYSYQDVVDDRQINVHSAYNLAGDHIRTFIAALGCIDILIIPIILSPLESHWLWISWAGVWIVGMVKAVAGFDPERPETGGRLHMLTIALGLWTVVACLLEMALIHKL